MSATYSVSDEIRAAAARVGSTLPRKTVERALEMYAGGWPPKLIADELAVGKTTVMGWRRASGLPRNGSVNWHRALPAAEAEETAKLYESGLSIMEVAGRLGVSKVAVYQRLESAGVPTRKRKPPEPPVAPDGFVTVKEAAAATGLSVSGVRQHAARGSVPGVRRVPYRGETALVIPASELPRLRARVRPRRRRRAGEVQMQPHRERKRVADRYLPVGPFRRWLLERPESFDELAWAAGMADGGRLRLIVSGDQKTIGMATADAVLVANDARLDDVWPDLDDLLAVAA